VKISRLKREADACEADARTEWLEFRGHFDRSLAIVRRRVGSPAGLAICFSLGFIADSRVKPNGGSAENGDDPDYEYDQDDRGVVYRLTHGPLGDIVVRLGTALAARSLIDFLNDGRAQGGDSSSPSSDGHPDAYA
jgi:hypothetical protein